MNKSVPKYEHDDLPTFVTSLRLSLFSSQPKTAKYFYVSRPTITRYESGNHKPPIGYVAALSKMYIDRLDLEEQQEIIAYQQQLLKEVNRAIKYDLRDVPFENWEELCAVSHAYMTKQQKKNRTNEAGSVKHETIFTPPVAHQPLLLDIPVNFSEGSSWIWAFFAFPTLVLSLYLVAIIFIRFLSGNPDIYGTGIVVVLGSNILLTAVIVLTSGSGRLFTRLRIPTKFHLGIKRGLPFLLLIGLIFFRFMLLPAIANIYNEAGAKMYKEGQTHTAQWNFERAIELNPNYAEAHYNLGNIYEDNGEFDKAHTGYMLAAKIGGLDAAYNNIAHLEILEGKYFEAISLLKQHIDSAKDDEVRYDMLKNMGWAYLKSEDYAEAEVNLKEAIEMKPNYAPAHCLLGELMYRQNKGKLIGESEQWDNCLTYANSEKPDENKWIKTARDRIRYIATICLTMFTLFACNSGTQTAIIPVDTNSDTIELSTNLPSTPVQIPPIGFNMLVEADGEIELTRDGWSQNYLTSMGTELYKNDLIQPISGSRFRIICSNSKVRPIPVGVFSGVNDICSLHAPDPPLSRNGSTIINSRDGKKANRPYVISPRSTLLLNETPIFRWNDTGMEKYTLTLYSLNGLEWKQENVVGTVFVYSGQPLGSVLTYTLIVEDSSNNKSDNTLLYAFQILSKAEANHIKAVFDGIAQLDISDEAKTLVIAGFYGNNKLIAEATQLLKDYLIKNDSQQSASYQMLGDNYARIGLILLAEQQYLKALELAIQQNNIEAVTVVQANLGKVSAALGNTDEAINYLNRSSDGHTLLGNSSKAFDIKECIKELKNNNYKGDNNPCATNSF